MSQKKEDKGTVLIIEDDPDFSEYLAATLTDEGYRTEVVSDGNDALQRARELQPTGITLDILLPGRTGIAIYRQLRTDEQTSRIPVAILTGVGTVGEKLDFSRFFQGRTVPPPDGFLQKPVEPEELTATVARALAGRAA